MPKEINGYIHTTIHDFKTHISRYIRLLEEGHYRGILLKRGRKFVGFFLTTEGPKIWNRKNALRNTAADIEAAAAGRLEERAEEGWS